MLYRPPARRSGGAGHCTDAPGQDWGPAMSGTAHVNKDLKQVLGAAVGKGPDQAPAPQTLSSPPVPSLTPHQAPYTPTSHQDPQFLLPQGWKTPVPPLPNDAVAHSNALPPPSPHCPPKPLPKTAPVLGGRPFPVPKPLRPTLTIPQLSPHYPQHFLPQRPPSPVPPSSAWPQESAQASAPCTLARVVAALSCSGPFPGHHKLPTALRKG